eukprot:5205836-Prymnesium_polylepis.2
MAAGAARKPASTSGAWAGWCATTCWKVRQNSWRPKRVQSVSRSAPSAAIDCRVATRSAVHGCSCSASSAVGGVSKPTQAVGSPAAECFNPAPSTLASSSFSSSPMRRTSCCRQRSAVRPPKAFSSASKAACSGAGTVAQRISAEKRSIAAFPVHSPSSSRLRNACVTEAGGRETSRQARKRSDENGTPLLVIEPATGQEVEVHLLRRLELPLRLALLVTVALGRALRAGRQARELRIVPRVMRKKVGEESAARQRATLVEHLEGPCGVRVRLAHHRPEALEQQRVVGLTLGRDAFWQERDVLFEDTVLLAA